MDPADLPPEARKHTPEGAVSFARYYLSQLNVAWTKPDDGVLPPLAESGCLSCKDLQSTAVELVAKGHRYRTNPITIRSAALLGDESGQTQVRVQMTQNRVDIINAQGGIVSTDAKKDFARTVAVVWRGNGWLLYGIA